VVALALGDIGGAQALVAGAQQELAVHYGEPNLARSTLAGYATLWDRHVLPRIGGVELRDLRPQTLERFRGEMAAANVGAAAQRKVLVILQGVLQRAAEWGYIPANPARVVRKPSQRRTRAVRPMAPATVEALRARLLAAKVLRSATLVSVLAYGGLRPGEALALTRDDVRDRRSWSSDRSPWAR
jgi:integrase